MSKHLLPSYGRSARKHGLTLAAAAVASALITSTPAFASDHASETQTGVSRSATSSQPQRQVTADAVLKLAQQQVGTTENASGGGTRFHSWYMTSPRAQETLARDGGSLQAYANAPWCAMFVSWVGEQTGVRPTMGWDAYTVTWARWFKNNGRWGTLAKPGAVVYYAWGGDKSITSIDHMGLVKKDNRDGTITAIEGNTGNGKVEERVRPKSDVVGYGYPQYKS
ncbi:MULTISPECIES: CHAP domain-containing protein [unclassified Nonomuraea]|uniref:CHAP domain-containing protein n=1 Tax=unclassified Nonomuraea TaxID=2593643 RepID=UPI0033E91018